MRKIGLTRRLFLGAGALSITATSRSAAETIRLNSPWLPHEADSPLEDVDPAYQFFTPSEVAFVDAAAERICPKDELGPGARDCRVTLFIDHQLAGAYGRGDSWFMTGPWQKGEETQGYQSRLPPADMYRNAIASIEKVVQLAYRGRAFSALGPADQDVVLGDIETGKTELESADSKTFFKMLLLNTKEGMFCDPIYGGNKDMAGWKMIGFPGARYDYRDWIGRHGERYSDEPIGIAGRSAWNRQD